MATFMVDTPSWCQSRTLAVALEQAADEVSRRTNMDITWVAPWGAELKGTLYGAHYQTKGRPLALVVRWSGMPGDETIATVNLPDRPAAAGCVWVKNYSENEGILEALEVQGVLRGTGRRAQLPHAIAHEAQVLVDLASLHFLS